MITTPFLKASTAPPPHPKPQRRVGTGFRTHSRLLFGVKCLHCYPGLTLRARATDAVLMCAYGRDTMPEKVDVRPFASISRSSNQETSSVAVNPQPSVPPPPSYVGSPLFWIGVGVGLSALFSWVAANLKKYAMQQAFKTMMGQMNSQNNQFNDTAFSSGSPFPFSMPSMPAPSTSPPPVTSHSAVTVDVPATNVEAAPTTVVKDESEVKKESKRLAFVDVSPEEAEQKSPYESLKDASGTSSFKDAQVVSQNGAASERIGGSEWSQATTNPAGSELFQSTRNSTASEGSQSSGKSVISVEVLEKMMEDPTVQKMVYPHLPEEFRNPDTLKWMLQNPQYRQQLEEML
ncbi:protein TIC 40, chloroplastic-like [Corylus avellana]|uniref:protein TIC 40, chloroplastic-like n=1 Tax=Corylus avellana TaxID=13451 RepID=UPI00286B2E8A|nr:protein TIC 40, chloroplastic-like [Corylus avellana]